MPALLSRFCARSDLHQSPLHAGVMRELGWKVDGPPGSQIFYRPLGPISLAKLQRPQVIDLAWLKQFRRTHHALTTYIEPGLRGGSSPGFSVEPFAHSATSLVDLSPSESHILNSFTQKTRYNITRSLKKNSLNVQTIPLSALTSRQLADFYSLHAQWSKQRKVSGYSDTLLNAILKCCADHGDLHLAYDGKELVGSLLTLYHDAVATYWASFASPAGYALYSPTLLTWTAMQTAKAKECDIFDFGGIYDPRYPRMYKRWVGFTKFKSGFNPTVVTYPPTTLQLLW